uniref:Homeobox domain-containing protein n=1 Tax=Kalanchoe fedtschenkoi TaxID=63787 RepID=A0A7N0T2D4_KALFE
MASYYPTTGTQRDAATMLYLKENYPGSYPEAQGNMMMMNYPPSYVTAYSNTLGSNAQVQQDSEIPSLAGSEPNQHPQQEMMSSLGEWRDGRNEVMVMHPVGSNCHSQGLSLSLGTQIPLGIQAPPIQFRNLNPGFTSFLGPNASGDGGSIRDDENSLDKTDNNQSTFGMSCISRPISNSRYLKVAQELLDEVVNVKKALTQPDFEKNPNKHDLKRKGSKDGGGVSNEHSAGEPPDPQESAGKSVNELSTAERNDFQIKLTKLLSMLDEVDRRYKQYYHQMQIVVSSFDTVAGNGASKPYTALALQTISRHFRCLRDAITNQIQATRKSLGDQDARGSGKGVGISRLRFVDQQLRQQKALQELGMMQQHTWRPQRGLPESSVSVLRAWLFEHFLHPYPKDSDKIMLARQTGLTRSQVSNWFINARVRLWKPMVEEMYKEEAGEAEIDSNSSSDQTPRGGNKDDTRNSDNRPEEEMPQQSTTCNLPAVDMARPSHGGGAAFQNGPQGETANNFRLIQSGNRFMDGSAAAYQHMSELGRFGNNSGVSLTLGLQNYEGGLLPMSSEPHRNFIAVRSRDMYNPATNSIQQEPPDCEHHRFSSSQLLHDFVA